MRAESNRVRECLLHDQRGNGATGGLQQQSSEHLVVAPGTVAFKAPALLQGGAALGQWGQNSVLQVAGEKLSLRG